MIKDIHIKTVKCEKCGKEFVPAPLHIYKSGRKLYCSWTCYNHRKDTTEEGIKYESYKN